MFRLIWHSQCETDRIADSSRSRSQAQFQLHRSLQRLSEDLLVPRTETPQHMGSVLLRERTCGCNLLVVTTEPGKQRQCGQQSQAGPYWQRVSLREVDDIEFSEWHIRRGRVEVGNGGDDDADDECSPDKAQPAPQPAAGPYSPVEGC